MKYEGAGLPPKSNSRYATDLTYLIVVTGARRSACCRSTATVQKLIWTPSLTDTDLEEHRGAMISVLQVHGNCTEAHIDPIAHRHVQLQG
ncbi:hypothetical protein J6590_104755 [Homalodisca vitripennis]|nr:hypothetical protein J6590_085115 [Homalodisca vitripennis]KAG8279471.1 hypothetical protein J6590_104755 [Homalodisca vitripennis]